MSKVKKIPLEEEIFYIVERSHRHKKLESLSLVKCKVICFDEKIVEYGYDGLKSDVMDRDTFDYTHSSLKEALNTLKGLINREVI